MVKAFIFQAVALLLIYVACRTMANRTLWYAKGDVVADTLIRLAEILEVSVSELLGAKIENENTASDVAEQLSRINEQLAIKNRRSRRIWKIVAIILAAIILINIFIAVFFSVPTLNEGIQSNQPEIIDQTQIIEE